MIPQFFTASKGFVLEGFQTQCSFDYFSRDIYTRTFMMAMIFGGFLLPLFLIIFFYGRIWLMLTSSKMFAEDCNTRKSISSVVVFKSKRNTKQSLGFEMKQMIPNNSANPTTRLSLAANALREQLNRNKKISKEIKLLKTIVTIVFMFCFAWLPYAIMTLVAQFSNDIQSYITPYSTCLPAIFCKLSSVYNPIIFILTSEKFKDYYRKNSKKFEAYSSSSYN